jgi:8-hydroxy-5-deazaflavin:NADPH oxidoreductase
MGANDTRKRSRREFLEIAGAVAAGVTLTGIPLMAGVAASATGPGMKIGIIGSGRIGGTLGGLWVKAGHEVMFSARNLDPIQKLVARPRSMMRNCGWRS